MQQKHFFKIALILLVILGSSTSIWAAESEELPDEEIIITATRSTTTTQAAPGYTELLDQEQLTAENSTTVPEALANSNGVNLSLNGGASAAATLQLDGCSGKQTLVLVNGIPTNTGTLGTADLSYFPTLGITQIEIVHGPLSSLYGANALGGVINLISDLTGEPSLVSQLTYGSFNTKTFDFLVKQANYGLGIGGRLTDGEREHSGTGNYYLLGQYDFFNTETSALSFALQHLQKEGEFPGSLTFPNLANQKETNSSLNLSGKEQLLAGNWEYKLYYQTLTNYYQDRFADDQHHTENYGLDLAGLYNLGSHELLCGTLLQKNNFNSTQIGNLTINNSAFLLQDNWSLTESWNLIAGLRLDNSDKYSAFYSPRLHLVKALNEQLTLKAGYGKAFSAPTVSDLYWPEDPFTIGNPDLLPESGERYDLTAEWQTELAQVSLNLFHTNLSNEIIWASSSSGQWTPSNIHRSLINGINLNYQQTWDRFFLTKFGYSYLDKKGWENDGYNQDLNHFGKHQLHFGLGLDYQTWQVSLATSYIAERSPQSENKIFMPNYTLVNLNTTYQASQNLSVNLTIDNLFDQEYQINLDYPMPKRAISLGMKYTL